MIEPDEVGYGRPPRSTRFQPGQSGNPKGRPRKRHRQVPHDAVLGQMVTIREDGRERRVTAAEAFLLQLTQKGLAGDSSAARASLEAIETARAKRHSQHDAIKIILSFVSQGIHTILEPLGLVINKHATDKDRVRCELNPWIVETALERLADRGLTLEQQREVWRNTRTPHKVDWPEWWTFYAE